GLVRLLDRGGEHLLAAPRRPVDEPGQQGRREDPRELVPVEEREAEELRVLAGVERRVQEPGERQDQQQVPPATHSPTLPGGGRAETRPPAGKKALRRAGSACPCRGRRRNTSSRARPPCRSARARAAAW